MRVPAANTVLIMNSKRTRVFGAWGSAFNRLDHGWDKSEKEMRDESLAPYSIN